jgi:CPA2 family monovalent cation:H+ antiporter-2
VQQIRTLNPAIPILARTHDRAHHETLRQAGATEVIQPELEAAGTLIRHALRRLSLPRERVLSYLEHLRGALEGMGGTLPGFPHITEGTGETLRGFAMSDLTPRPEDGGERLPELREITLAEGVLADRTLRDARVRERFGVSVMAIQRADGTLVLHPSADTLLRRGDRVRLFGLPEQIDSLLGHADESG